MGYVTLQFRCIACNAFDSGNPHKVPSLRVTITGDLVHPNPEGTREPLCRNCAKIINQNRIKAGIEPVQWSEDAYEPIREEDL